MQTSGLLSLLLQQFMAPQKELAQLKIPSVLSVGEFQQMLNKEKIRADRLSSPFTVVQFKMPTGTYCKLCECLVRYLSELKRVIDEVGFFDDKHLAIYLFNTPLVGAELFLKRLVARFKQLSSFKQSINVYPDSLSRPSSVKAVASARIQERLPLLLNAQLSVISGEEQQNITAQTLNISSSGAFIITDVHLDDQTEIEFEFTIPLAALNQHTSLDVKILAKGRVIRSVGQGFAVAFEPSEDM